MKASHILAIAALTLAGCGEAPTPAADGAADGGNTGELTISDGRLVLPAVSGNPGAAYFTVTNGTAAPASLAAASVEGAAKAEMHETTGGSMSQLTALTLGPGATATFAPGGKHVMVFGVPKSLQPGATTQLKLTFAGGKTASGTLQVQPAGGGDMH